jgi:chromosomal replication initiation ATPase DnaA
VAQLVLPLESRPALGREDFILGAGNREAVAFIDSWPAWPAPVAALHGPPGSGKSHLAAIWAARADALIVDAATLDERVLGHAVVIENADHAAHEAIVLRLFLRSTPILFTARTPPAQWPLGLPDLQSRYRSVLPFELGAPDDDLLTALAGKLFADRQLAVPDQVIFQMVRSLERSPAAIRDFVARADAKALSEKRPITPTLIREILAAR